jgi:hypothetical protein
MGATHTLDRVAASVGLLTQVDIRFEAACDVSNGGVLLALPALLACGLLRHAKKYFTLPKGFYGLESLFLLLALMALARLKSVESLRYVPPGEWGKILGLDRIPEARTLRNKVKLLVKQNVAAWSVALCNDWMQNDPQSCGMLYVDGHVRIYYGSQTKLPRHYVSRERLCLRATTDYWVNAMDGCPFFYTTKEIDPGLLNVLENDIVPRLEKRLPTAEEPTGRPGSLRRPRCTLIYDREGYSPAFMQRMRERGIACISYHKHPGPSWPEDEFQRYRVQLVSGEVVEMELAERGVLVGQAKVWMREIRRRSQSGHQTSVLSTHDGLVQHQIAASMFARWSQENFFRYMREHYGLDRLVDYCLEEIPDSTRVVNPDHRQLDGQVRKKVGELNKKLAEFGALRLEGEIEPKNVETYERKKTEIHQQVAALQQEVDRLKQQRRQTPRHITVSALSEEHRFKRLSTDSKHFVDTVKMVAYRAETAMASILREHLARSQDTRTLLRSVYDNEADLIPNDSDKTLTVRLHHIANHAETAALKNLCEQLNATETVFPGTEYRLVYELGSPESPRGQDP